MNRLEKKLSIYRMKFERPFYFNSNSKQGI